MRYFAQNCVMSYTNFCVISFGSKKKEIQQEKEQRISETVEIDLCDILWGGYD